jgi:hypothetical protein
MIRRYDLRRSDNFMNTAKISVLAVGDGTYTVVTGFPVTRASVAFTTIPVVSTDIVEEFSSSSTSGSDSSSSSESMGNLSSSSSSETFTNLDTDVPLPLPRIFVSEYRDDGFVVTYQNIPEEAGFFEFNYNAV